MTKKDIEIVIGAKNEASKILEQVSQDTSKLSASLERSSSDAERSNARINLSFFDLAEIAAATGVAVGAVIVSIKAVTSVANAAAASVSGLSKSVTAFAQRTRDV